MEMEIEFSSLQEMESLLIKSLMFLEHLGHQVYLLQEMVRFLLVMI